MQVEIEMKIAFIKCRRRSASRRADSPARSSSSASFDFVRQSRHQLSSEQQDLGIEGERLSRPPTLRSGIVRSLARRYATRARSTTSSSSSAR